MKQPYIHCDPDEWGKWTLEMGEPIMPDQAKLVSHPKDEQIKDAMDDFADFASQALKSTAEGDRHSAAIAEANAKLAVEQIERLTKDESK